jgi:hypothetical protein
MILYRTALAIAVAFCVLLAISASAKEYRSALVDHCLQLTHVSPATGCTSAAYLGHVRDHIKAL